MLKWWVMLWLRRSPQLAEAYRDMRNRKLESNKFEFHLSELLLFLAALAVGVCYVIFHSSQALGNTNMGGLGIFLSQLLILGIGLVTVIMRKQLRSLLNGWDIALFVSTLLMGLSYMLYSNQLLRRVNLIPLVVLTFASLRAMTNASGSKPFTADAAWEGFSRLITGIFKYAMVPFRALATIGGKKEKQENNWDKSQFGLPAIAQIAIFLLALTGAVMMVIAVPGLMGKAMTMLGESHVRTILAIIGLVIMPFVIFSLTYAATHARTDTMPVTRFRLSPGLFAAGWTIMLLSGAALLVYWLGNPERRAVPLPFAPLTVFALLACLFNALMLSTSPASRGIHLLAAVGTALALFFDIYAFTQTMSNLNDQITTIALFLAQPILVVLLTMQLVRLIFPKVRINQWACAFLLFGWALINTLNISAIVGSIVIDSSQSAGAAIDANFLIMMGPDVMPALSNVKDEQTLAELKQKIGSAWATQIPVPYDWGLAWTNLDKQIDLTPPENYESKENYNPTIKELLEELGNKIVRMVIPESILNLTLPEYASEAGLDLSSVKLEESDLEYLAQLLTAFLTDSLGVEASDFSSEDLLALLNMTEEDLAALTGAETDAQAKTDAPELPAQTEAEMTDQQTAAPATAEPTAAPSEPPQQ